MDIRIGNYIDEVRYNFETVLEFIINNSKTDEQLDDNIIKYFEELKENSYDYYTQIVGLIISDHYKRLYDIKLYEGDYLEEDDKQTLELYSELNDNDDVINLVEEDPSFLLSAIYSMMEYESFDYFEKREILNGCKPIRSQLFKFSTFNIYDYLYYTQKYTAGTLKLVYEDCLKNDETKEEAIKSLIMTIEEVYYAAADDKSEYFELISDLLSSYYVVAKYESLNKKNPTKIDRLNKTIKFLESSEILEIIKKLNDNDFGQKNKLLIEVLKRYINFKDDNLIININDETYNKTLKKLRDIKEF